MSEDNTKLNEGYLTIKEVCQHFRFSRVTLYRLMNKDNFPRPLIRGKNRTCKWSVEQIAEYEEKLKEQVSE